MDNKNIVSSSTYKLHQVSLDIEVLICCLIVDSFLIKEKKIPFVSVLYYIILKSINSQISNQNFINKINIINEINKVNKVNRINKINEINKINKTVKINEVDKTVKIVKSDEINQINECNKSDKITEIDENAEIDVFDVFVEIDVINETNKINEIDVIVESVEIGEVGEVDKIYEIDVIDVINETNKGNEINKISKVSKISKINKINKINKISKINKINKKRKEAAVIMSDCKQKTINENDYEYGKKYYFDKSGMNIEESEAKKVHSDCKKLIETCCRIQIPRGFKLSHCLPGMCFNLSNLDCIKSPIVQKVDLPSCECKHHLQCEVVAGYEIRAVGDVNFSVSLPICPEEGYCFPTNSHACCTSTVPVNKVISYTCCPKICPGNIPCVDWTNAYFCTKIIEDCCGPYVQVELGVVLEFTGVCDCDEE